ncbi:MAG: bifunctional aspartate kinase/homoserine dehydrogenase I [Paludibacteraceae bacterium]|nr:bifunctional aspartate kinase/homoserine dehydrogenase I [Paludibacteraceae bacterium]MBR4712096.1 bifunctional aspartate kinase/homoserine dehydrogenase I [Paludibacteraceae bacterium]MBR5373385.1 bifunctional aspartate kinase/homoserine dehydrogenase I [Paludibacteraceae bacterium]
MKVLKFGGASVGSIKNLQQVKKIVEGVNEPVVIVVSAVEHVTDMLEDATSLAAQGSASYTEKLDTIITTHNQLIEGLLPSTEIESVKKEVSTLHEELMNILKGVYLIKDLTSKTEDAILSYGERIASLFVSRLLGAKCLDSRNFIKTNNSLGSANVDFELTYKLIREQFASSSDKRIVIAGFIASDAETADVTTLGRGGSDCTAALVAAALGASKIEIWNTNDGFMTADPSVTRKAYKIEHLSYSEAMELCNFGATVIFPPSIYPACVANIPIQIMNIEKPDSFGTLISTDVKDEKTIKGISSIENTVLVTIQGMGMMNVHDVNSRIFMTLDYNGIHTFFVSQASSGSSISIGVRTEDAETVMDLLGEEFNEEMSMGAISSINTEKDLSTIAIVGDNMRQATGTAGKLFNALGRNNINIIALAQGSAETNISCVVKRADLRKALNCIHESFFLSEYQQLNLFVVGTGTVGGSLLEQLHTQKDLLMKQNNLMVKVIGIADVSNYILDRDGIDLTQYQELLKSGKTSTPEIIKQALIDLNIYNCVFVDCTASGAIANIYKDLLLHNISVVAANKIAASGDYDNYMELKNIARKRGIKYLYETNVGAGLPIINTINDLIFSGDRIVKLEAVLSGTLNFIFNTISKDIPLSKAIRMAMEARFAEPDPRIDLSGKDVIRKLVILARESGIRVEQDDVEKNLFIPNDFFEGSLDDFWKKVEGYDAVFEEKRKAVEAEGKHFCFVAKLENGKTSVGLQAVGPSHPFFDLRGSNNLIIINTARYQDPMMIRGYGAGAAVTAAGVFADIISIANIR